MLSFALSLFPVLPAQKPWEICSLSVRTCIFQNVMEVVCRLVLIITGLFRCTEDPPCCVAVLTITEIHCVKISVYSCIIHLITSWKHWRLVGCLTRELSRLVSSISPSSRASESFTGLCTWLRNSPPEGRRLLLFSALFSSSLEFSLSVSDYNFHFSLPSRRVWL